MVNEAQLRNYFCRRSRGWQLSLFAAVCLVYLPFLGNPLFFDDLPFFSGGAAGNYAQSGFNFNLRWFSYASLGWTTFIFSDVITHFFHLGNALIHVGNAILLFFLLRELVSAVMSERKESHPIIWGAWLGALVFACHPVAVYAVGYVVQRSILMATFFVLLMQWTFLRGLLTGQKRWLMLSVVAYFVACFSKEHSVLAPAVLVVMMILLHAKNRLPRRALWLTWIAFIVIGVLVVLRAKGVFGSPYEAMAAQLFEQQGIVEKTPILHLLSVLTQAGLFFKYLFLWLLPNPAWMSVDMREQFVPTWTAWQSWLGALGFVLYGVLAFRLLLRSGVKGLIGLALLYPWLQFMLEFSSIRVQEPFVLYRSYLWMPGMMLFFPLLMVRFSSISNKQNLSSPNVSERVGGGGNVDAEKHNNLPSDRMLLAAGCLVLLLVPLSWNRLWVFADTYRLWNDAALLLPNEQVAGADRIFYNRGNAQLAAHKFNEAIADLQRVVTISPQLAPVHYALGIAYFNSGRYQEALSQFNETILLKSDDAQAYYGKGISLKRLHEDKQAMQQIEKSCELKNMLACVIVTGVKNKK